MKNFILIILLLLALSLGYYMVIFEPNNIQIERQIINIENLPQSFERARIVHLSDIQSFWFGNREKRVLDILEELKPDFIFITGDFVDSATKMTTNRDFGTVKVFWQELGKRHRGRIFAVLGNHDPKTLKNYLNERGIIVLDNENKKLIFDDQFIYLIGIDDPWIGRDDLPKAMKGIYNDISKILLSHSPDIISEAAKQKIDLVLVGHTHGGQVSFPFLGPLWIPSKYGRQYAKGLFRVNSTYLYVNRGIGTSMLPIRFNCPPEITLIELKNK